MKCQASCLALFFVSIKQISGYVKNRFLRLFLIALFGTKMFPNLPIGYWEIWGLPRAPVSAQKDKLFCLPEIRSHFGSLPHLPRLPHPVRAHEILLSVTTVKYRLIVILQPNRPIGYLAISP